MAACEAWRRRQRRRSSPFAASAHRSCRSSCDPWRPQQFVRRCSALTFGRRGAAPAPACKLWLQRPGSWLRRATDRPVFTLIGWPVVVQEVVAAQRRQRRRHVRRL